VNNKGGKGRPQEDLLDGALLPEAVQLLGRFLVVSRPMERESFSLVEFRLTSLCLLPFTCVCCVVLFSCYVSSHQIKIILKTSSFEAGIAVITVIVYSNRLFVHWAAVPYTVITLSSEWS